jgi:hypothetical protein
MVADCVFKFDKLCTYSSWLDGRWSSCRVPSPRVSGVCTTGVPTLFYSQPAEFLGSITIIPYTRCIPARSNTVNLPQSSALFTEHRLTPSDRFLICFSDEHRNIPKCCLQRWCLCGQCIYYCYQCQVSRSNRAGLAGVVPITLFSNILALRFLLRSLPK